MASGFLHAHGGEIVDAGESPGTARDHADADALILEQLDGRDHAVLDREPLHGSIDDSAIGVGGARSGRRIECSLTEMTHEGGVYGPPCCRTFRLTGAVSACAVPGGGVEIGDLVVLCDAVQTRRVRVADHL